MGGQTSPENLAERLVEVVRTGGTVVVVGWTIHNHNPLSLALMKSSKVRFLEDAPKNISDTDFVIFTNIVNDVTVNKVRKLTDNFSPRRFTFDGVRQYLQAITEAINVNVPATPQAFTRGSYPVQSPTVPSSAPITNTGSGMNQNGQPTPVSSLEMRLRDLRRNLAQMDAAEKKLQAAIDLYSSELTKLKDRQAIQLASKKLVSEQIAALEKLRGQASA